MEATSSDRQGLKLVSVDRGIEGAKPHGPFSEPIPLPTSKAPAPVPQGAPAAAGTSASAPPAKRKGKLLLAGAVLAGLVAGGNYGWHWWTVGRFQETTDNAFLQADKVTVAPKVAGFVSAVLVADNQPVKAGDVLATIDDADYKVAIAEAQADLEKAVAQLAGYKAAVVQQQAQLETSRADIINAEAALTFAQQEAARSEDLLSRGAGTTQRAQQTRSDLVQRQGTLTKSRAALVAAEKQVVTYEALAKSAAAAIAGAQAKLDQAKLNLGHTTIRAPIDGVVGMDQLILPQLLRAAGPPLFTVPLSQISTAGLAPRDTADASALSNMMRNLGGSIGIATLSTMIERREHFHFSVLAETMTRNAVLTQQRLGAMMVAMQAHVIDPIAARAQALNVIAAQVRREAFVMAYSDAFWIVGVGLIASLAAIVLLRKPPRVAGPVEAH